MRVKLKIEITDMQAPPVHCGALNTKLEEVKQEKLEEVAVMLIMVVLMGTMAVLVLVLHHFVESNRGKEFQKFSIFLFLFLLYFSL